MGIVNKVKSVASTAAIVAGSVTGQPSTTAEAGKYQNVKQQKRQTASLQDASRTNSRPTTSGRK